MSTSMYSGRSLGRQPTSTSTSRWVTIPPARLPGQPSSLTKCSGTRRWISLLALIRWKSMWMTRSVAGSRCTDFSTAWLSSPSTATVRMWEANASFSICFLIRCSSSESGTGSWPPP